MMMISQILKRLGIVALLTVSLQAGAAFDSGSTGADGPLSPSSDVELQVPPSGVFHFTTVNIPAGVKVTFKPNAANTPVIMLASGNVTIAGTIDVSGKGSANTGTAGDGNPADDGQPGLGGPGGFRGALGGIPPLGWGGTGWGPGGGLGGDISGGILRAGGGGGFLLRGSGDPCRGWNGGEPYGNIYLLPLIGGSGGGGGTAYNIVYGVGGAGGGGAILIAASGTITITGAIIANGGTAGTSAGPEFGAGGGGGSGGAIRLIATAIVGNGLLQALGGKGSVVPNGNLSICDGGDGSPGRIRLEAESLQRTEGSTPQYTYGTPGPISVPGAPTVKVTKVGALNAPAAPTGVDDVMLPTGTTGAQDVVVVTTGIPVGTAVTLVVKPATGTDQTVVTPPTAGTLDNATATVSVAFPTGRSTITATASFAVTAAAAPALRKLTQGQEVKRVRVAEHSDKVVLITAADKEIVVPMAQWVWAMSQPGQESVAPI